MVMRLLCLLLLLVAPLQAAASSALQADLKQLVSLSSDVVVGQVQDRQSFWQGQRIYTKHIISVDDTWRGPSTQKSVEVLTLGGVVGDLGQHVAGSPKLQLGDQLVLFLARDSNQGLHPVGLSQGVFYIGVATPKGHPTYRDLREFDFIGNQHEVFPGTLEALKVSVKEVLQ